MTQFRFLGYRAKRKAVDDYILGWTETHENEVLDITEVYSILMESDGEYDIYGNFIGE
jgi:hypothetical protein